jgi:D-alanyl-D-alanine carboxypeptidase
LVFERETIWENTNKLLGDPKFSGVKTGITNTAGSCLASLYHHVNEKKEQDTYIVVVLGCTDFEARFEETKLLLYWFLNP